MLDQVTLQKQQLFHFLNKEVNYKIKRTVSKMQMMKV